MEFFNNKNNNILKFKINSEGIDSNKLQSRLIFETSKNKNYIFYGKITENNVCAFELPELQLYEKGDMGTVKFEIISEDELYFPVWKESFEIKTNVNITLEKLVDEIVQKETPIKPKITMEFVKEDVKKEVKKETIKPVIENTEVKNTPLVENPVKYDGKKLTENIMLWLRTKFLNKETNDLSINLDDFLKQTKIDKNQFLTFVKELDKTKKIEGFDITVNGDLVKFSNFEKNTKNRIWEENSDILTFEQFFKK